jgi:wyosine [tRNA(Phe)-imidazoG37] synthetase (radical SAM superfamily)
MTTFLFDSIIFGPVWSRRLGESLGVNLLPVNSKVCNFNCIYCECGLTPSGVPSSGFPTASEVRDRLHDRLQKMKANGDYLDSITFAGNGEPTLHPEFPRIMEDAAALRNAFYPKTTLAVLSNATRIGNKRIFNALLKADLNILKLDSALEETLLAINCPNFTFSLEKTLQSMIRFQGKMIIQTMFFRGSINGTIIDNSAESEVNAWLSVLDRLHPQYVMLYSIARDTALPGLEGISAKELGSIAARVEKIGIRTVVTP